MTRLFRHLLTTPAASAPPLEQVHPDFVIILAALLSALICFLGVLAITRCARMSNNSSHHQQLRPASKGLKKNVINSLPTQPYSSEFVHADCVICLAEFADGDAIRVLPPCGHGFHVACIDKWLELNTSCPSCRHVLAVGKCRKCGGVPNLNGQRIDVETPTAAAQYLP